MSHSNSLDNHKKALSNRELVRWHLLEEVAKRANNGDERAFKCVVESMLPLVLSIAGAFRKNTEFSAIEYEDLVAVGNISLMSAIRSWDKEKGLALSTWAHRQIKRDIGRAFKKESKFHNSHISYDSDVLDKSELLGMPDTDQSVNPERVADYEITKSIKKTICTKKERSILYQLYVMDRSVKEVADNERLSRQAVNDIKNKALVKLRLKLT